MELVFRDLVQECIPGDRADEGDEEVQLGDGRGEGEGEQHQRQPQHQVRPHPSPHNSDFIELLTIHIHDKSPTSFLSAIKETVKFSPLYLFSVGTLSAR